MARLALINKEKKRAKTVSKYNTKRVELKEKLRKLQKDSENNFEDIEAMYEQLRALPRDASPSRIRNRCRITGRSRGYYRKVGLSRSMFRLYAMNGDIPGLVKSSW